MASDSPQRSVQLEGQPTQPQPEHVPTEPTLSSTPVEMSNLQTDENRRPTSGAGPHTSDLAAKDGVDDVVPARPLDPTEPTASTAIDSSAEQPTSKEAEAVGPVIMITLLLTSGARHPYKIDDRYLKKRNVSVADNDPFQISVYTLKELIWREWREEWESRPLSPSSIRLIHFGRLLDDNAPLKECRFNADAPNVIHMTVKPQEVVDDEDAKTAKQGLGRDRGGSARSPSCRCIIL